MEALILQAIDEVALEGAEGCPPLRLWQRLADSQQPAFRLTEPLKQAIWGGVLEPGTSIALCHAPIPIHKGPSQRKRQRTLATDSAGEEDVDVKAEPESSGLQPLAPDELQAALEDSNVAEERGYRLQAAGAFRNAMLGIQDSCLSRYPISNTQVHALERVATYRREGVLRSELSKTLGMDAKAFHYVATSLEGRGLIGSVGEMIKGSAPGAHILTSRLFLKRFQPPAQQATEDDRETQSLVNALAGCPAQTAVESDIKAKLGYWERDEASRNAESSRRKHRRWRKVREKCVKAGLIELFKGTVDTPGKRGDEVTRRVISFVRLLEEQKPGGKALRLAIDEGEETAVDGEPEIVAELGLDGHIMRRLLLAGEEGVTRSSVGHSLGLTAKKANRNLSAFAAKFGIREAFAQQGKAQIKMWKAPLALLTQHESMHPPPVPPGGWVAAVTAAAAPLELLMTTKDILEARDGPEASLAIGTGNGDAFSVPAATQEALEDANVDVAADCLPSASQPLDADSQQLALPKPDGLAVAGQGTWAEGRVKKVLLGGALKVLAAPKTAELRIGDVTLKRERWLVDALQQRLFMRVSALRQFFREMESREGMTHGTIDGLTLKKIIRRTTGAGQLQFIAVALPQSRSSQGVVERQFLVNAGVPLDDHLLRKIMDAHTQAAPPREARELPAMDAQFGVDTQGRLLSSLQEAANDFNKAMAANGYLRVRAVRMRLLHQHICAITGMMGAQGLGPTELLGSKAHMAILNGAGLWKQSYWHRLKLRMQSPASESDGASTPPQTPLTLKGLWDSLPLSLFLQVCGTSAAKNVISELNPDDDRPMGKLTCEHLEAVVDARTFSRLKDLLDGLATIGLLAPSLVRTDSSGQSAGLREARWAAAAHAVLEEPALAQGPLSPLALTGSHGVLRRDYTFQSDDDVKGYWAHLEQICCTSARDSLVKSCWPIRAMPELLGKRKWSVLQEMSYKQRVLLDARLAQGADLEPDACRALAADLGLAFQQVQLIAHNRKREQIAREQGIPTSQLSLRRPEGLMPGRRKRRSPLMIASSTKRQRQEGGDAPEGDQGNTSRAAKLLSQADMSPSGSEVHETEGAGEKQTLSLLARQEREAQIRVEQDANRAAGRGAVTHEQRKRVMAEKARAARRRQAQQDREQLRRLQAEGRITHAGAGGQWLAEDEEGGGLLPRRRKVVPREDRVILRAWFRFHCRRGLQETCFRKNRRLLPDFHLTENMARTRIATMQERGRSEVAPAMERLGAIAEEVYRSSSAAAGGATEEPGAARGAAEQKEAPAQAGATDAVTGHEEAPERASAAPSASEGQEGKEGTKQKRTRMRPKQVQEHTDAIRSALQDGPLFQSKDEGWRDLHAEAVALIEEVSTKAEGHRKPDAPSAWPKRDRLSAPAHTSQDVQKAAMEGSPRLRKPKAARKPAAGSAPALAPVARQRQPALQEDSVIADLGALSALAKLALSAMKPQPSPVRRHRRPQSGLKALSAEAAAAVELVKCSLLSAESARASPAAERARLLARFGEQQLVAAYRLLCEQDQLYVGGISKAYALSDAFKASLQVLGFPSDIFEEAAAAASSLDGAPGGTAERSCLAPDGHVSAGLVAHALGQLAAGRGTIRLGSVKVEHRHQDSEEGRAHEHLGSLRWEAHIEVQHSSRPAAQCAAPTPAAASPEGADREPGSDSASLAASAAELPGGEVPAGGPASQSTAPAGLQQAGLDHDMAEARAHTGALSMPAANHAAGHAIETAQAGAACGSAATSPTEAADPQILGHQQAAGASSSTAAAEQSVRAGAQPQQAPWADSSGKIDEPYWRSLTQRALSAVMRSPGIPEDALLDELDALLPASALRLLSVLERGGLLSVRSAAQPAPRIPRILMRHNQAAEPSGKVVRHFFPVVDDCFRRITTLQP